MCDVKLLLLVILTLHALKFLKAVLGWIYPKTKTKLDDQLFVLVCALIMTLEWVVNKARGKK